MSRAVQIVLSQDANDDWRQLNDSQREQVRRLIKALALSPRAGWYWSKDDRGRSLFIVSASDTHLVYSLRYVRQGEYILIVAILTFPLPSIHEFEERQRGERSE